MLRPLSFSLAVSEDDFSSLSAAWRQLFELEQGAYFHSPDWYLPIKQHLIPDLNVVAAFQDERLVLVLPLTYCKSKRSLSLPLCKQNDLLDALFDQTVDIHQLARELLRFLDQTYPDWATLEAPHALPESYWLKIESVAGLAWHRDAFAKNIYIPTTADGLGLLSRKQVKNVRRHGKKLSGDIGPPEFRLNNTDSDALQHFLEIEHASWKGVEGLNTSILSDPAQVAFYQSVAQSFAAQGQLSICFCTVNGEMVAGKFTLICHGVQYLLKISYRPEYHHYGPGNLLLLHLVDQACVNPELHEINLVTGPAWAERWHAQERKLIWSTLYNNNVHGNLQKLKQELKDRLRPLKLALTRS